MLISASEVETGSMMPDLDNGYVFEVEPASDVISFRDGFNVMSPNENMTAIGFHDADGNECYLVVPDDFQINVTEGGGW